jgi:hypothetical protein
MFACTAGKGALDVVGDVEVAPAKIVDVPLVEHVGAALMIVVAALALAFIARLLNHRRKEKNDGSGSSS